MEALSEPSGGDQNKGLLFCAVALTFCALACVSVLLRLYVRVGMIRSVGWDDFWICVTLALSITNAGINVTLVIAGFGRHGYYLSYSRLTRALKYIVLTEVFCILTISAGKISICIFLLRILEQSYGKKKKIFLYFIIGLNIVTAVIPVGQLIGHCHPVSKQWNPIGPGYCADPVIFKNISIFNGAVCAWLDFSLAAFPITFIKDLQLSVRKKVALAALLSCGAFTGICAIIRTSLESKISAKSDRTWAFVDAATWAMIEANITIIVACIPTLQPLYIAIVKKLPSTRGSHEPSAHLHRARNDAAGLKRNTTFSRIGNARDVDPETGAPFEMTTYISSVRRKDSSRGKGLVSNAAMPGITAETDIRLSGIHMPR